MLFLNEIVLLWVGLYSIYVNDVFLLYVFYNIRISINGYVCKIVILKVFVILFYSVVNLIESLFIVVVKLFCGN